MFSSHQFKTSLAKPLAPRAATEAGALELQKLAIVSKLNPTYTSMRGSSVSKQTQERTGAWDDSDQVRKT